MRIFLADHHKRSRFALRALLGQQPELEIVGETGEAEDLLGQLEATAPDLLLLDWQLRGQPTAELLPILQRLYPNLYVVVLNGRPETRRVALSFGADDFVCKADPPERLLGAIQSARIPQLNHPTGG